MSGLHTISYVGATIAGLAGRTLRTAGERIVALDEPPVPGDAIVALDGARLLPGLINAHDHLQLNSLPRPATARKFQHVRDWIGQIGTRPLAPALAAGAAVARDERLLIGGLKNLLAGVTTVAHHDPLYPALTAGDFPVEVLRRFGWSHSLYLDGEAAVRASCRHTPPDQPWIIHLAEGTDAEAAEEFDRLERLGGVRPNTVLVHGIALSAAQRRRLAAAGGGLIWCPASNLHLFEASAAVGEPCLAGSIALGTDSRLSGSRDLLDELGVAARAADLAEPALEALVTGDAARLLRLEDRGVLRPGARADLLVLPAQARLGAVRREAVRLVVTGGRARYGEAPLVAAAGSGADCVPVSVDGHARLLDACVVARLARAAVTEPGLEIPSISGRAA